MIYGYGTDLSPDDGIPQGCQGCLWMTSGYSPGTTRSSTEAPQDTLGQHRDASGRRKDTPDGYMDLAETHGWGLRIIFFPADVRWSIAEFYFSIITCQASPCEVVITRYVHAWMPMAIKGGEVQLTSQIQCR